MRAALRARLPGFRSTPPRASMPLPTNPFGSAPPPQGRPSPPFVPHYGHADPNRFTALRPSPDHWRVARWFSEDKATSLGVALRVAVFSCDAVGSRVPPPEPSPQVEPFRRPTTIPLDPSALSGGLGTYRFCAQNQVVPTCPGNGFMPAISGGMVDAVRQARHSRDAQASGRASTSGGRGESARAGMVRRRSGSGEVTMARSDARFRSGPRPSPAPGLCASAVA